MFDFSIVTKWFHALLTGFVPEWLAIGIECLIVLLFIITLYAILAIVLIYAERKICAFFQCRIGPNRVGKWGLLQSIADMIKILLKEIISIDRSDKVLFVLAPFFVIMGSILTFAALPFGKGLHAIDFNIGVFYLIAVSSLGIIGILLA